MSCAAVGEARLTAWQAAFTVDVHVAARARRRAASVEGVARILDWAVALARDSYHSRATASRESPRGGDDGPLVVGSRVRRSD
jgi:hypothetical protein